MPPNSVGRREAAVERLVADLVVDRLRNASVQRVFGYSGDGINAFMGALRRAEDVDFVQARHEEAAAFMAVATAKYGGGLGVVTSTQGPGAVHLLNGLYDAKLDHVPVLAIVGQQDRSVLGSEYQQEIDLQLLFRDVAGFVQTVMSPESTRMVLDRAMRIAVTTRTPAVVVLPHDVQKEEDPGAVHEHGVITTASGWTCARITPDTDDLEAAAELLQAADRPAILLGQGGRDAREAVVQLAERLGAGVTTSLLGKPGWDETLPISCGVMGHLGTPASGWLMKECDTLLIVGSNDPWTEFYPAPGQARAVQVDLDPARLGNRYPIEVGLHGDAGPTIDALLELIPGTHRSWGADVVDNVTRSRNILHQRAATLTIRVNPELVVSRLSDHLPEDARVAIDVGSVTYWYARHLRLPVDVPAHLCSTLACMGAGIPYGLAAKLDAPDRPVVVLSGDGAFQMAGLAELVTVGKRWRDWADPRFVVLVLHNSDLAEVTWEQREMEGEPRFDDSQNLPTFPYAEYADLLGLTGLRVSDPSEIDHAWQAALSADRPVVIEAMVDPDVPLLPPFPAGQEKLESFRRGLGQEGETATHAAELLEEHAQHEQANDTKEH
jgi:pyruvate dehydrogenase (quinone)